MFLGFMFFLMEVFTIDVTALLILCLFTAIGFLDIGQAISGFSNSAVITIAFLFILSHALEKTGILEYLIVYINNLIKRSKRLGTAFYLFTIGIASSLINNTAIVAIFMPITIRLSRTYGVSPSKLLIPLSYSAIIGGTLTLVGTSTNLLVNSIYIDETRLNRMGMFEFAQYGIILMFIGLLYLIFIAPLILPSRTVTSSLTKSYHLGGFLTEMKVSNGSPLIDKSCLDRGLNYNYDVTVLDIIRNNKHVSKNIRKTILQKGDILFVRGSLENFIRMKEIEKVTLLTDEKLTQKELEHENNILVECLLTEQSDLVGKSLMASNFRRKFGSFILAIRREGDIYKKKIAHVVLQTYDTLLVYGPENNLEKLSKNRGFIILTEVETKLKRQKFWWLSILVTFLAISLAAFQVITITQAAMTAVVILLLFKQITPQESYKSIHWQVIVLISALIPIGIVMQTSGTADWIGNLISRATLSVDTSLQPYFLLGIIYFITMVLTEISSNAATAIIMVPITLSITEQLGINSRPFVFAVAFAASSSFITPIGYQTNLMVYGPGGYKFTDFIKVGLPLALIFWILAVFLIPIIWPFN